MGHLWSCLVLRYSNYVFSTYYLLCFHENQQGLFTIKATHVLKVGNYGNRHYRVSCSCYTSFHSLFPVTVTKPTRKRGEIVKLVKKYVNHGTLIVFLLNCSQHVIREAFACKEGHLFCKSCIEEWVNVHQSMNCPSEDSPFDLQT